VKWDPLPAGDASTLTAEDLRDAEAQVAAVREAVGPGVEILLDLYGRLDPHAAIRLARAIAPYRPYFLEEPVLPTNIDALARVARAVPTVPLATGERVLSKEEWWPVLERGIIEHAQPDVVHTGGIWPLRVIAAMAEARRVGFAPITRMGRSRRRPPSTSPPPRRTCRASRCRPTIISGPPPGETSSSSTRRR
jgi:galactonate dehydratase